jgi:trimeric autotransporter adhesin
VTGLTEAFASKNVLGANGSTLTVTGYTVNDGDGGEDYTVTIQSAPGTITPTALTITATSDTKVYDGTTSSSQTPTYGMLYSGDTVTGLTEAFTSKNVVGSNGSTLVVTGYVVNDGDGGKDYTVTTENAAGTITPTALVITAISDTKVYDGTTSSSQTPTVGTLYGGDTVTGLTEAFTSKNVLGSNDSTLVVTG